MRHSAAAQAELLAPTHRLEGCPNRDDAGRVEHGAGQDMPLHNKHSADSDQRRSSTHGANPGRDICPGAAPEQPAQNDENPEGDSDDRGYRHPRRYRDDTLPP